MRIAIIGTRGYPYVYSGYETFGRELGERLAQKGIGVTIYCHKNLFRTYPEKVNRINLVYLPTIEKKSVSQLLHSLQSIIHASLSKNDILLVVNSGNGPLGFIARTFGKKTAINTDGVEWLRPKWKGIGATYFRFSSRLATKLYNVVVTDSLEMQRIYEAEFGAFSRVIAYGANVRYSKTPALIQKWDIERNEYYLVVGRLIPDNNADLIVREFNKLQSDKKLVIVGDVPYKDRYAEEIKRVTNERVVLTGYVKEEDELAELYTNCFAYIHGHEFGGTNPTMLTAMACGCAVMALDTPFTREMCDNENHAWYFTKKPGHLRGLLELAERSPSKLAVFRDTARDRIKGNYTWEKVTDEYIQLFKEMLADELKR